ncbi:Lrp/AsnC family transcriptional regulator [Cobetia marina]
MNLNRTDSELLNLLIKDGRMSYADIARKLGISRAHARSRVEVLVERCVIQQFTAVINPSSSAKGISTFVYLTVAPSAIERIARSFPPVSRWSASTS